MEYFMPKSRTPRGLDPEMRRRALAWARDMSRWMADIDEEARWQARRNGRDEPDDDDAITAFCKLFDGGYGLPWSSEWNGEPAGPQPPAPAPPRLPVRRGSGALVARLARTWIQDPGSIPLDRLFPGMARRCRAGTEPPD
jgi:hypothetical protein